VAWCTVAGGTVDDGGDYSGHTRTSNWFQSIQYGIWILTVLAPLANIHRSRAGDEVLQRQKSNGDEATLQGLIEQARDTVRCWSSPGSCRAWWRGRGWSESRESASPGGGGDELDEEVPG
jgi:hypothetical protein